MKNKTINTQHVKELLWKNNALDQFDAAWAQLQNRDWFAVEANGGFVTGTRIG